MHSLRTAFRCALSLAVVAAIGCGKQPATPPTGRLVQDSPLPRAKPDDVFIPISAPGIRYPRFDHKAHAEKREIKCATCHHAPRPEKPTPHRFQRCMNCHEFVVRVPMKTNSIIAVHDVLATSGVCIDCHKKENAAGKVAPVECNDCHIGPMG